MTSFAVIFSYFMGVGSSPCGEALRSSPAAYSIHEHDSLVFVNERTLLELRDLFFGWIGQGRIPQDDYVRQSALPEDLKVLGLQVARQIQNFFRKKFTHELASSPLE